MCSRIRARSNSAAAQHLQSGLGLRGSGVHRVLDQAVEGALSFGTLDNLERMRPRPHEAVDPHDDQRVALVDPLQHSRQHRAGALATRGMLLKYLDATRSLQSL